MIFFFFLRFVKFGLLISKNNVRKFEDTRKKHTPSSTKIRPLQNLSTKYFTLYRCQAGGRTCTAEIGSYPGPTEQAFTASKLTLPKLQRDLCTSYSTLCRSSCIRPSARWLVQVSASRVATEVFFFLNKAPQLQWWYALTRVWKRFRYWSKWRA